MKERLDSTRNMKIFANLKKKETSANGKKNLMDEMLRHLIPLSLYFVIVRNDHHSGS